MLEALGVTLSKRARARSVQLPAWNEALGLPRPWDQQWSLRIQQVLAYETDLFEYDDILDGSHVVEARTAELVEAAQAELDDVLALGGAFAAIDELKGRLVASNTERTRRIESGEQIVVGVNAFTEIGRLAAGRRGQHPRGRSRRPGPARRRRAGLALRAATTTRSSARSTSCGGSPEGAENIMPATIDLAHAGGTTGEWAGLLREVFGEYRAPDRRGRRRRPGRDARRSLRETAERVRGPARRAAAASWWPSRASTATPTVPSRSRWRPATPAWRSSTRASASRPAQIAAVARDEDVDVIGLSVLSGSHLELVPEVLRLVREAGSTAPVVVGGIIPDRRPAPPGGPGRGRRLHPQGLRAGPDHGRHRRPGRGPPAELSSDQARRPTGRIAGPGRFAAPGLNPGRWPPMGQPWIAGQ